MSEEPKRKITYKTKIRIGPSGVKVTQPDKLTGEYPQEPESAPMGIDGSRQVKHITYRVQPKIRINLAGLLVGVLVVIGLILVVIQLIFRR